VLVVGSKGLACPARRPVMPLPGVVGGPSRAPKTADSVEQSSDKFPRIFGGVRFCDLAWLVWLLMLAGSLSQADGVARAQGS
jgi:hypothetical protein